MTVPTAHTSTPVEQPQAAAEQQALAQLQAALCDALGTPFSILDGNTGDLLWAAPAHRGLDWLVWAELSRGVAERNRPELIEDDDPWVWLAIPLNLGDRPVVALAAFATRAVVAGDSPPTLGARRSGGEVVHAGDPVAREVWPSARLLRVARLLVDKCTAERAKATLEKELSGLSLNLATTYEEISLLYDLTHNLKLSSRTEELGQRALEWLADVSAGRIAGHRAAAGPRRRTQRGRRTEPPLLVHGPVPLDADGFARLIAHLGIKRDHRPTIVNQPTTDEAGWPFADVRQAIIVPLSEGTNLFGYLAVFNHRQRARAGDGRSQPADLASPRFSASTAATSSSIASRPSS